jgi:hypothetical protein
MQIPYVLLTGCHKNSKFAGRAVISIHERPGYFFDAADRRFGVTCEALNMSVPQYADTKSMSNAGTVSSHANV